MLINNSSGAWLRSARLEVSGASDLAQSLVATGFAYLANKRLQQARTLESVLPLVRDIRRAGSAALDLAWVASGRLDGYYETGVQPWDVKAGALLVVEAGGRVSWVEGIGTDIRPGIVAACGGVHERLLAALEPKMS